MNQNTSNDDFETPLGRVLAIAGSDSSGGAGIQADIKTITALGGYAASAITALTAQSTKGVISVDSVAPDMITAQIKAVLTDIGADAIKIGMLADVQTVQTVAAALDEFASPALPVVLDPVMVASSGDRLLADDAIDALKSELIVRASVLTPNAPEAAAMTGIEIEDMDGQRDAAEALLKLGARAVLVKGGHLEGSQIIDLLATRNGVRLFTRPRIRTRHTHGTGCTLSSAIATLMAQGLGVDRAVEQAGDYLHEAISSAPGFGSGHGPVNHGWTVSTGFASAPVRMDD